MNIKTNFIEDYVNFVDRTKKQNKYLWICTIVLEFIVIINRKYIDGILQY